MTDLTDRLRDLRRNASLNADEIATIDLSIEALEAADSGGEADYEACCGAPSNTHYPHCPIYGLRGAPKWMNRDLLRGSGQ